MGKVALVIVCLIARTAATSLVVMGKTKITSQWMGKGRYLCVVQVNVFPLENGAMEKRTVRTERMRKIVDVSVVKLILLHPGPTLRLDE